MTKKKKRPHKCKVASVISTGDLVEFAGALGEGAKMGGVPPKRNCFVNDGADSDQKAEGEE